MQPYVSYTARRAIVQEFTPSDEERELSRLVADYLRRPNLKALPEGQRQLISLVLWKLLASSSRAIAGALATMAERLQTLLDSGNSDALAQSIYKDWLKRHAGSDRITGSKTADTRAALVEHFKERGTIMIATEAGAEGINLQFCSLVINYDLPWNPQRIEQRIGRCHRYGQKHDVVVVNFVDRSNEADARVYELLQEKFQLFEGVFGASDEVLGAIGSGVDFERRIADIYRSCRSPEEVDASFAKLRQELSGEIDAAMLKTRQIVLENFDEAVQAKLRFRAADSRSRYERMLLEMSRAELGDNARFDDEGFTLQQLPKGITDDIATGRYELPRRNGDAHLYRITHPLAQWALAQAKNRRLAAALSKWLAYNWYFSLE